jgi:hypothetical protein
MGGRDLHWLSHWLGLDDASGPIYSFYSGVGADLSELAVIGGLVGMYRRHNCHVHRCWRVGRHPVAVDGTTWTVCRRHHPADAPTADAVRNAN